MEALFIKPAPGCSVRDPKAPFAPLNADGEEKPMIGFWLRRIADGSVVRAERPKVKKVKKEVAANESV
ncbi:TPA: DUF2635 domain-containing protein [Escherichia coli]|nr:DUF2635 domain-containing protein [Escherichia coli]